MTRAPRRVLVVEDESAQRLMYARALDQMGYESVCVGTINEARSALGSSPVAVALLDLNLSGEHGLELFEHIRERRPAVSVVIATGYGTFELAKRAIRMDAVDFLSKPVGLAELESAIGRAWDRHVLVQTPVARLLPPAIDGEPESAGAGEPDPAIVRRKSLNIELIERELIMEALRRSADNRKAAAQMLGISERKLYYRLTQYRVRRPQG